MVGRIASLKRKRGFVQNFAERLGKVAVIEIAAAAKGHPSR
jgi:hypothetical protein